MVSSIVLAEHKREKQSAREALAWSYNPLTRAENRGELMEVLSRTTVGSLDRKVKHRQNLTFTEAFCGMCYVLAATNNAFMTAYRPVFEKACGGSFGRERAVALASAFLNLMACKETFSQLLPEEVSGMVAAAMMDPVIQIKLPRVVETCGMGGDKGFGTEKVPMKGINASTLSSLVLASLGLPTVKHGSYGNTSAVGSTEAIELFGAHTSMTSKEEVLRIIAASGYCFFDAHWCKTIHDLSHLLMMETVNHVIGPMTPPLSPDTEITKVMGVNEKVHPETIALAYRDLARRGFQKVGGVIAVAGLYDCGDINLRSHEDVRKATVLDELSPYLSVVSIAKGTEYIGTFLIRPESFGVTINARDIRVQNDLKLISAANMAALRGTNVALTDYLAMNASLGLLAFEYIDRLDLIVDGELNQRYLKECFVRCRDAIIRGDAGQALDRYVEVSKQEALAKV